MSFELIADIGSEEFRDDYVRAKPGRFKGGAGPACVELQPKGTAPIRLTAKNARDLAGVLVLLADIADRANFE